MPSRPPSLFGSQAMIATQDVASAAHNGPVSLTYTFAVLATFSPKDATKAPNLTWSEGAGSLRNFLATPYTHSAQIQRSHGQYALEL